jgi:hypothetical protein
VESRLVGGDVDRMGLSGFGSWGNDKVSTLDDTFGTSRGRKYLSRVKC